MCFAARALRAARKKKEEEVAKRRESSYIDKIARLFFSHRYRRCAARYHPERQSDGGAETIFALAAEAYEVLSDPLRRAAYDRYGEEGLKNGVPGAEGFANSYVYHGDPMRTFRWSEMLLQSSRALFAIAFRSRDSQIASGLNAGFTIGAS